ncbi:MAG: glutathione S-transferase family protein [Thalassobaculum sp.]|uniref:glutathione S-transferase family protein n=1 Tax=Thalassobaculum sp. TaxID=2022740 RepID=UPI0032ED50C4
MTLTIYGSPRSRTMRVLWAAAELGLDHDHMPLAADDPALKTPEFLRLNPAGAIPVIDDDGFVLAESMAIILYLTRKHATGTLYPAEPRAEAEAWRWSLWAQGHIEPWVQRDRAMAPLHATLGAFARARAEAGLSVLDRALTGAEWLVGERFTVADLNVAGVLSPSRAATLDLARFPSVRDWLARCYARPAAVATRRRFG